MAWLALAGAWADTWTDSNGVTWTFTVSGTNATITKSSQTSGSLVIPSKVNGYNVTSIGFRAFYECSGLTSVNIPSSVTSIGGAAFQYCSGLTSVTIPSSVTSIGEYVFAYCHSLTSVTVSEGVTSISAFAFAGCTSLTSVTIPEGVTSIGESAFQNCTGLQSVTIPEGVTDIREYAFYRCSGLTSITIPSSVTSIGVAAFSDCTGLTSVTIPEGVTSIDNQAFRRCSGLTSIKVNSGNTTYDSRGDCNAIIKTASNTLIAGCKNTVIPNTVTSIGIYAFSGCSGLTSVTIPSSVTSIGIYAFEGCSGLTSVTIPSSVTTIRDMAFSGCSGLTSVFCYVETPLTISSSTFSCYATATLYVPVGTKSAYQNAAYWSDFITIKEMTPPSPAITFADANVKALCVQNWDTNGDGELSEAEAAAVTNLGTVFRRNQTITTFNELQYFTGLTSVGDSAFYNCSTLTSVTIPNSVTSIGKGSFQICSALTSAAIPNSVTTIGNNAFRRCSMTSVTIPNSVTSIGDGAFSSCSNLTSIIVENGNNSYISEDGVLFNKNKTTILCYPAGKTQSTYTIPSSVTRICSYAFDGCSALTSVTIPNSVTIFGQAAFRKCSDLTSVTIPESVTSIGKFAFQDCSNLTTVTVEMETPLAIDSETFTNRANATLYVPAGCKAAYEAAAYWQDFNIVEMAPPSSADNISAEDITLQAGGTKTVDISLTNTETNLVGFQMDLTLPEGVSINKSGCSLSSRFSDPDQTLTIGKQGDNVYRLTSTSYALTPISGTSGTLLTLSLTASGNSAGGTATLSNIRFVTSNSERVTIDNASFYIDTSPVIVFADANVKAICVANWDTNGDGELSEAEAAAVTNLGTVFRQNKNITSFDELQYFTGLTSIADSAFYACSYMASVTIPSSVTTIGNNAFLVCNGLTSVTIPKSVTSIGNGAFSSCSNLTSIIVENGSSSYADENGVLFNKNKTSLLCYPAGKTQSTYTIPSSVTSIGRSAFNGCSKLTSVTIPSSVTDIGLGAFWGCKNLTSVTIPNSVTSIGNYAFNECSKLTSVDIPNSVTTLGYYAFFKCYDLTSVTIGNSVTNIGMSAFRGCTSLTSVNIPESVTNIQMEAFKGCSSLTSVTIPSSVTSIGVQAFKSCSVLTSVKVGMVNPPTIETETFTNCTNATLYVPKGCKSAYQAAEYWSEFKNIKEFPDSDVNQDGEIDMVDVVDIARFVVGIPAETFEEFLADLNSDDDVNVADAVVLINEIVGDVNFAKPHNAPHQDLGDERLTLTENGDHSLSVSMESQRDYTAFQFDIYTNSEDDVMGLRLNTARKNGHQLIYNKVDEGHYRIVALSVANNTFKGNNGELLNIQLDGLNTGDVTVGNIHFITTDGTDHRFDDIGLSNVTGIERLNPDSSGKSDTNIYDISGRKVSESSVLPKGVYIVNGKKVVVK